MSKVIVERPRIRRPKRDGSHYPRGSLRAAFQRDLEDSPRCESMGGRYGTKWLRENLAPLQRFLLSCVGRDWDEVYSEICARISLNSAVQRHILEHLWQFVFTRTRVDSAGRVWAHARWTPRPLDQFFFGQLYVCPATRKLLRAPLRRRTRNADWRSGAVDPAVARPLVNGDQLRLINGCWFYVQLGRVPRQGSRGGLPYDVVLRGAPANAAMLTKLYGSPSRYAVAKRQLGRRELKRYGLRE